MAPAIRTIGHDERLSLVDHLDELRSRLIISGVVLIVAFGFCLWQNHELLHIINQPLETQTKKQVAKGQGTVGQASLAQKGVVRIAGDTERALGVLAKPGSGVSASARKELVPLIDSLRTDAARLPRTTPGDKPVTLGVGEPFTTTITVTLYFALILSLPVILFEMYGFVLPALKPNERRAATPLLTAVPFLFAAGVLFGYFVVLPAAVRFFVNFNSGQFNVLVQANQFYSFAATVLLAMGMVFQVPVLILGAARLGLVTPRQLRRNRRYALLACASVAAFLPGDVITLVLETVPLYVLYEASILLARFVAPAEGRHDDEGGTRRRDEGGPPDDQPPPSDPSEQPTVQQMIDHVDPKLTD
jgi:sec-independent protein translocase protein TatC